MMVAMGGDARSSFDGHLQSSSAIAACAGDARCYIMVTCGRYMSSSLSPVIVIDGDPEHTFVLCSCLCSDVGRVHAHVCVCLNKVCVQITV